MGQRKKWVAGALSVLALVSGCSVFGVRNTPEPAYEVVVEDADARVEIREYAPMILAVTTIETTDYGRASSEGFRRLAGYIFGKNARSEEIGMTAPVYRAREGENIGMTAPVLREQDGEGRWRMSFVMPERYTLETLPRPVDERVTLETVPSRTMAVIRYSGAFDEEGSRAKERELLAWAGANGWEVVSTPRAAGYDPPMTLPFLRRNEVLVEVSRRE